MVHPSWTFQTIAGTQPIAFPCFTWSILGTHNVTTPQYFVLLLERKLNCRFLTRGDNIVVGVTIQALHTDMDTILLTSIA